MLNRKQKKGKFVKGAIFGTLVGGIAALLLAPKSGKETQEDIKQKAKKVAGQAEARLDDLQLQLDGRIDELKQAARGLRGEALEESKRLIGRAEILRNDLQDTASKLARQGKALKDDTRVDAKRLVSEGQAVITELERATKKIMNSARTKTVDKPEGGRGSSRKK